MREVLYKKGMVLGIICLFVGASVVPSVISDSRIFANPLYVNEVLLQCYNDTHVDDDYNEFTPGWQIDHFKYIQDGINALCEGGTVHVYNGTYDVIDGVDIDFPLHLSGESRENTIIRGELSSVIKIKSSHVNISNFTIKWSLRNYGEIAGIRLYKEISNINIKNNIIKENSLGIYGEDASEVKIYENYISSNDFHGIELPGNDIEINNNVIEGGSSGLGIFLRVGQGNNRIRDNIIENSGDDGIWINSSDHNNILHNTLKSNGGNGIKLDFSDHNNILYNIIEDNDRGGIRLYSSSHNNISHNFIKKNGMEEEIRYGRGAGIYFSSGGKSCDLNKVYNNNIELNLGGGILIHSSNDNTFWENDIIRNGYFGFRVSYIGGSNRRFALRPPTVVSKGNKIYHNNFIDNKNASAVDPNNYKSTPLLNYWDNGEVNDSDGNHSEKGGNHWSDYEKRYGFRPGFNHSTGIWYGPPYGTYIQYDEAFGFLFILLLLVTVVGAPLAFLLLLMDDLYPVTIDDKPITFDNHPWYRRDGWHNVTQVPPDIPTIDGPTNGMVDKSLCFTFKTSDKDNDTIFYEVNWSDGNIDKSEPHPSGEEGTLCHTWHHDLPYKIYHIRARAKDDYELYSDWSDPYMVNITKSSI